MKKIIILIVTMFLMSGCVISGKAKEPTLKQLTRVDVEDEEIQNVEVIFGGDEEINQLIDLFKKIDWEDGEAKMARKPDLTLHLFFDVEEGMPESIRPYDVWFNLDGTATFVDEHNSRIGQLKESPAKKLQELINEKLQR